MTLIAESLGASKGGVCGGTNNEYPMDEPALRWLEVLLGERFGAVWRLCFKGSGYVLSLNGQAGKIVFPKCLDAFSASSSDFCCANWYPTMEGWRSIFAGPLPAPGLSHSPEPLVETIGDDLLVHYDILGLVYWTLSRIEELGREDLDEHGRFPAIASHAFRNNYIERPIVDEWLYILRQIIQVQWPGQELLDGGFTMQVSHDVDRPSLFGFASWKKICRGMAGDVVRRRNLRHAALAPLIRLNTRYCLHPRDPANTFEWLMDLSEQRGLKSAFYFICGRTSPEWDADYEPDHQAIRKLMRSISERGHELGLHPSYRTFKSASLLKAEADRLIRIASEEGVHQSEWGGRMHYLRWENPVTVRACLSAGLAYDSSLGYADHPGFRCGTCHEYAAFDPVARESLSFRVRPLVAMETTIVAPIYLGLGTGEPALEKFTKLKHRCEAVKGCFSLLWHNCSLQTPDERALYQAVLDA